MISESGLADRRFEVQPILEAIKQQYALAWDGLHGVTHWARVYENGLRIAKANQVEPRFILLFSLFHDACRVNDGIDPGHGRRGAELAADLHGRLFQISDRELELLLKACALHTHGLTEADVRLQTCWDADRLDLARASISPSPKFLCTQAAKDPELIAWATERSLQGHAPERVLDRWGVREL